MDFEELRKRVGEFADELDKLVDEMYAAVNKAQDAGLDAEEVEVARWAELTFTIPATVFIDVYANRDGSCRVDRLKIRPWTAARVEQQYSGDADDELTALAIKHLDTHNWEPLDALTRHARIVSENGCNSEAIPIEWEA